MRWERMEVLGITVKDLDKAMADFSRIFGIDFDHYTFPTDTDAVVVPNDDDPHAADPDRLSERGIRIALDHESWFELVEIPHEREGLRNIHFKVDDIDAARDLLIGCGLTLVTEYRVGDEREVIFTGDALHGVRLCVWQYDTERPVQASKPRNLKVHRAPGAP